MCYILQTYNQNQTFVFLGIFYHAKFHDAHVTMVGN
jgi:hypothetical protein